MVVIYMRFFKRNRKVKSLDVDDVFADALNLSSLDKDRLEGKFTSLIPNSNLYFLFVLLFTVIFIFSGKLFYLQIMHSAEYKSISENNSLEKKILFPRRGVIKDRYGRHLAFNANSQDSLNVEGELTENIYLRKYTEKYKGLSHVLGYLKYPAKDKFGKYWRNNYEGVGGVEEYFNERLNGKKGWQLIEKDATGKVISYAHIKEPEDGENITLSIDAELSDLLYRSFEDYLKTVSFKGGAAAIMDIKSGEILALISVPEYDANRFTLMESNYIKKTLTNPDKPLLNRAVLGTYAPGSIVKPFVALAALHEGVINSEKKILSTGALVLPNPYNPDKPTIFKDWKAHGWVNMKEAIAHSSDEYFYVVGGGYKDQEGLGIKRLLRYMKLFGFGEKTNIELPSENTGLVPSPAWKKERFGEDWHIGNTYHTSIGQYGFLVTVLQALRAVAFIADSEYLRTPTLVLNNKRPALKLPFSLKQINVIQDAMRMATNIGTARPLKIPGIQIAAKTGTAQTGANNEFKNSWVIGFWPYKNPRFAFAAILEKGDEHDHGSASHAMREFFFKLLKSMPDYAEGKYPLVEKTNEEDQKVDVKFNNKEASVKDNIRNSEQNTASTYD